MNVKLAAKVAAMLVALDMLSWFLFFRRRARRWGVAPEELDRLMPGDDLVENPSYFAMQAVTVDAPPDCIYPWLVQMGEGRGGLYSWDFLDRIFGILSHNSAKEIRHEWQDLQVGDQVPVKNGPPFPVAILEPNHAFVLADPKVAYTWQTVMYPQPDGTTRLVTRNRANWERKSIGSWVFMTWFLEPAAFFMVHRWLRVLKQRAEQLYAERLATGAELLESEAAMLAEAESVPLYPS